MSQELRERALFLFDLRGQPEDVLSLVAQLELDAEQQQALNNLKSLIDLLQNCYSPQISQPKIVLDLSLIQTFDYYTGIVFNVVSSSQSGARVLAQGGRYDQLLGLYHPQGKTEPGIGFSFNIEDLHQVLLGMNQLPQQAPSSDWLVVPETPQAYTAAFAYAEKLRESTQLVRVEMELGRRENIEDLRDYARRRGIHQIAWVNGEGIPRIETVN
jgi:ATP phosphoribosyltransferase regulatory subunit